jgi:hypothetical protein
MIPTCTTEGCTFDTTGRCVLGNEPDECPSRGAIVDLDESTGSSETEMAVEEDAAEGLTAAPLQAPPSTQVSLPLGGQLTYDDLEKIGSQRGYRMIGILGLPNAGKTAALVSLYLLAANGRLGTFRFRNSASLFGFDEIAAGTKAWDENGEMLEKIIKHTELADPRRPGFLHLRLHSDKLSGPVDFVFPDLPGEWTDSLIDRSDHERLGFMRSAEALWILIDGSALVDLERRQAVVNRAQRILSRVRQYFDPPPDLPILLVVSRRDQFESLPEEPMKRIQEEAAKRDIRLEVVEIASVSEHVDRTPGGFGIETLLNASIRLADPALMPPSAAVAPLTGSRQMLRFRSDV